DCIIFGSYTQFEDAVITGRVTNKIFQEIRERLGNKLGEALADHPASVQKLAKMGCLRKGDINGKALQKLEKNIQLYGDFSQIFEILFKELISYDAFTFENNAVRIIVNLASAECSGTMRRLINLREPQPWITSQAFETTDYSGLIEILDDLKEDGKKIFMS